jgi:hypothetical protein
MNYYINGHTYTNGTTLQMHLSFMGDICEDHLRHSYTKEGQHFYVIEEWQFGVLQARSPIVRYRALTWSTSHMWE